MRELSVPSFTMAIYLNRTGSAKRLYVNLIEILEKFCAELSVILIGITRDHV
jgi:hypothetical protein